MKRQVYNLTDEPFAMFANRIENVLKDESIKYSFVGGISVQSYLLDMLTKKYDCNVCELSSKDLRIQDYLRSTDDIDMALELKGDDIDKVRTINKILPKFALEDISFCGESIVEIKPERVGASRPTFRFYVDGEGNPDDVIALNIGRGNGQDIRHIGDNFYNKIIDESNVLEVPYNAENSLVMKIPKLEHLLATKIAGSRAKDLMDIKNLTDLVEETGRELDFKEMEHMLLHENEENYSKFLGTNCPSYCVCN